MSPKFPTTVFISLAGAALAGLIVLAAGGGGQRQPAGAETPTYPPAPRGAAVDVYHGVEIADPYRPLEDLEAPATKKWLASQNALTATRLGGEIFERHRERLEKMLDYHRYNAAVARGERLFLTRTRGSGTNELTYLVAEKDGEPRPLLDPHSLGEDEAFSSVFSPSPDGVFVAYGVRRPGKGWNRLRIRPVEPGAKAPTEELEGIHANYGNVAWSADGRGFFYTRFTLPAPDDEGFAKPREARILYHRVGTPQSADRLVHQAPANEPDRWFIPQVSDDGRFLVVRGARAAEPGHQILLADLEEEDPALVPLVATAERSFYFQGNVSLENGSLLYFHTNAGAERGRVIGIDPRRPGREHWREVIAESADVIRRVDLVGGHFLISYVHDTLPRIAVFDLEGRYQRDLDLPMGISWGGFTGRQDDPWAYFQLSGLADPGTLYRVAPQTGRVEIVRRPELDFDPGAFVLERVKYESHDGTAVPMFLAYREGLEKSSRNPAFLYAYGAFGWSAFPWFQPHVVAFMEAGGVYALAGVRGGGEYGDAWHEAGRGRNKETAIGDFLAAAEWLVEQGYTSREKLAVNGGSASGVLAGAALTRRPELFAAAVIDIPVLDMLRFEQSQRGEYWVSEYGTVADKGDFQVLRAYSPLHNLEPETCYPATLITVGERDETATPWLAYKFAAALQDAQSCPHPALLQIVRGTGHGFGTSPRQSAETWARQLAFLELVLGPLDEA